MEGIIVLVLGIAILSGMFVLISSAGYFVLTVLIPLIIAIWMFNHIGGFEYCRELYRWFKMKVKSWWEKL
jgi:hypothetical protein